MPRTRRLAVFAFFAAAVAHAAACERVDFEPARAVYHDKLPELGWKQADGAGSYLVELIARVPEGPLIERRNLRTSALRADLPRLDSARPTKVTIAVTPECGSQRGASAQQSVLVMPSAQCRSVEALVRGTGTAAQRAVRWRAIDGETYEVRSFDANTGELQAASQHVVGRGEAELPSGGSVVVAVRRVCAHAAGPSSYLFVD